MAAKRTYPSMIPRRRAVAAMHLANELLDHDEDLEPADKTGELEVTIPGDVWARFIALATKAAKAKA
jgi:hypothetical protein